MTFCFNVEKRSLYFSVIMEKLLRCCDINTLYILIRSKKGKNVDARCDEIFDDAVGETQIDFLLTKCFRFYEILYDRFSII